MKHLVLFILLSFFIVPGCTFLRAGDSFGEDSYQEDGFSDEESEDFDFEEESADEEFVSEEESEEDLEEEDEYVEEKQGGLKGFFSRIFGSEDEEDDEEYAYEDEEDEEYAYEDEGGEEYAYEDEEVDSDLMDSSSEPAEETSTPSTKPAEAAVETSSETKPSFIPLKKIRNVPYRKAGYLVNAVYIARSGETLESISQQIYGSNQVSDLYAINPHLQSRSVKVGDKIYYNSPSRREDSSRLLFYYQDINAPSSFYTLSPGDNIRKVSFQLLGHPDSWKEIWASNPELQSKGEITNSINITYWPREVSSLVSAPAPSPAPEDHMNQEDEPLTQEVSDPDGQMQDKIAELEEPAFPPVLEKEQTVKIEPEKGKSGNILELILKEKEVVLSLLGIIVVLILMIRLILRKRKQRDFDYTATNVKV